MIIKNPKIVIHTTVAVLLIAAICVGCTFTGADKSEEASDFPEVDMVFSTDSTDLVQIGRDAADFYYGQFMADDIPQYWHITEYETPSCDLMAGDEAEFVVWITSYIGTDGGGFLVGQGIPNDPDDISKGGVCPELGQQFRIKALGDGQYEIVGVGTGGYDQGLAPVDTTVGDAEEIDTTTKVDRTNLDACVSQTILDANAIPQQSGDFATEAHTVLKTVEDGNETTVYAMVLYMEFGYEGEGFSETSSSHMPVAIAFGKNNAGEYELKEYWEPQDGDEYAPSIEAKFPSDIYEEALDTQKYIDAHMQSCYAQTVECGNAQIAGLIETITSSPLENSDFQAYIDEHQMEYQELIYLGEYTLRYCFALFEQGGQTGLKGHIMAAACREILGDAGDIDVPAATGQAWYDALPQSVKDQYR